LAVDALRRELREEVSAEIDRPELVDVMENLFV